MPASEPDDDVKIPEIWSSILVALIQFPATGVDALLLEQVLDYEVAAIQDAIVSMATDGYLDEWNDGDSDVPRYALSPWAAHRESLEIREIEGIPWWKKLDEPPTPALRATHRSLTYDPVDPRSTRPPPDERWPTVILSTMPYASVWREQHDIDCDCHACWDCRADDHRSSSATRPRPVPCVVCGGRKLPLTWACAGCCRAGSDRFRPRRKLRGNPEADRRKRREKHEKTQRKLKGGLG